MLNSQLCVPLHFDFCSFTMICVSGLYSWMANWSGKMGSGGGGTPPFLRISSCESVGCAQPGFANTSPKRTAGLCESKRATAYVFFAAFEAGSTWLRA